MTTSICRACTHPQAVEIDEALSRGERQAAVARRFSIPTSSMNRHRSNHLRKRLRRAAVEREAVPAGDLLEKIDSLNGETLRILKRALRAKDHELALKAIARAERQVELVADLTGLLKKGGTTVVNVGNVTIDADTGRRMAEVFLERHAGPAVAQLPAAPDEAHEDLAEGTQE